MAWSGRPSMPAGHEVTAADIDAILDQIETLTDRLVVTAAYKTADTSRSNTTSFTDDPHLTLAVAANGVYAVDCLIIYQAGATGQFKHQLTFPSGTMEAPSYFYDPGTADGVAVAASSSPGGLTAGFTGTGGNVLVWFKGTVILGGTGGTLAYQWAQTVSNGTATILRKGSRMILTRLV